MERIRDLVESAALIIPRTGRLFTATLFLIAACNPSVPTIVIDQPNGQVITSSDQPIRLENHTKINLCTSRAMPLDPNPEDISRFMSEASLQGGAISPGGYRIENGTGTQVAWGPC